MWPTATVPSEAPAFVEARLAEGADYIKIMVEDGAAFGTSLPMVPPEVVAATVEAAHERGVMALVHTLSATATRAAVEAGADGLTHLHYDEVITDDLIIRMREQGMFVISTLAVTASAASAGAGARLGADLRVASRLDVAWRDNLGRDFAWNASCPTPYARSDCSTPPASRSWPVPMPPTSVPRASRTAPACTTSYACSMPAG